MGWLLLWYLDGREAEDKVEALNVGEENRNKDDSNLIPWIEWQGGKKAS
jgi:hypothetical protein